MRISYTLSRYIFWDLLRIFLMASGALAGIMSFGGLLRPLTQQGLDRESEARSPKPETNSKLEAENSKPETRCFVLSSSDLELVSDFVLRVSDFLRRAPHPDPLP